MHRGGDGRPETQFFSYANPNLETTVFVLDAATGALLYRFNVPGISWSAVALADLDHDGYKDLVLETYVNSTAQGKIYALHGNGTPVAGWPQTATVNWGFADIAPVIGDVNGDCRYEILVGNTLYQENGTVYPAWPVPYISRSTGVIANFDTDAALELATGGGNMVAGWRMESNAVLNFPALISFENLMVLGFNENFKHGHPLAADMDGDGQIDFVRQAELGSTNPLRGLPLYVYDGLTGAGKPQTRRVRTTEPGGAYSLPLYSSATVGDLNGDGRLDLVVVARGLVWAWAMGTPYVPAKAP